MNRTQPERFVCGTFRCKQRLSMQNRIFINIFTLTYVKRHPNRDFRTNARKSRFLLQTGSADSQYVMVTKFCQESR